MKYLVVLSAFLAVGFSADVETPKAILAPAYYGYPQAYNTAPWGYNHVPLTYANIPQQVIPQAYAPTYAIPAPVAVPHVASSQFAAQDEFGNSHYGYSNVNSVKQESGNSLTGVSGSYQYVDANEELQTVTYVADGHGFRTIDSRLPVGPVANLELPEAPVYNGIAPEPVEDTQEVADAKASFNKLFEEAASRQKRESDPALVYGYNSPYVVARAGVNPYYYNNGYNGYNSYNGLLAYNNLGYYGNRRFAYGYHY